MAAIQCYITTLLTPHPTYGIIFGAICHLALKYSEFKKIRIITNLRSRDSCRYIFKKMKILPLCSQYIYTMSLYIVNNKHLYTMYMEIRNFNTRYNTNLHPPISNLTKFQKGAYYCVINIFSHLPAYIKSVMNDLECACLTLKRVLNSNLLHTWRI